MTQSEHTDLFSWSLLCIRLFNSVILIKTWTSNRSIWLVSVLHSIAPFNHPNHSQLTWSDRNLISLQELVVQKTKGRLLYLIPPQVLHCNVTNIVTFKQIFELRNRELLGSRPLTSSWQNTSYATRRGEAVSSPNRTVRCYTKRPRWRHTATRLFPTQRRCKYGDDTTELTGSFFVLLVLTI
jgi:hypothetical protein